MKYVGRTATEYNDRDDSSVQPSPLSDYRSERAYVLLGDPGAGKTTIFKDEAEADGAMYVTAREFVRGDLDGDLDAENVVLFIDGLDEMRAGGGDLRSPLDQIVARLRKLGRPRFRISCRPADWGLTDTNALQSLLDGGRSISDGGRLPVLRLDPLGGDNIRRALDGLLANEGMDTADFVRKTMERGLDGLLDNPQSLQLLTSVVLANGSWPASRTEVFENACRQLVREQNLEHIDAGRPRDASKLDVERTLDAAGRLSALFLLTDAQAICKVGVQERNGDLAIEEVDNGDREAVSRALATKLFTAHSPGRFVPVHLHIAEYVGARFLRKVIEGSGRSPGLPSVRVAALLTGYDGGIVAGLRGLAAWLAALCGEARRALLSADPIGVLAYGDVSRYGSDDLADLIRALEGRTRQLSRRAWSAPALGSMVRRRTITMLRAYITEGDRSDAKQAVVDLLLRGIPHAVFARWATPGRFRATPLQFIGELLCLARDPTWSLHVRRAGLAAALYVVNKSHNGNELVDELLVEVKEGRIHDPDNELRGRLLTALYPGRIPPEEVWDYVPRKTNRWLTGHDFMFWRKRVEQNARSADLPILMDGLLAGRSQLLSVLREDQIDDLVHRILTRTLTESGEETPVSRLSKWIEVAVRTDTLDDGRRNTPGHQHVRSWFVAHPEICSACLLEFLERNAQTEQLVVDAWRYRRKLFDNSAPPGFAAWCLDYAIELANAHAPVARLLVDWAVRLCRDKDFDRWVANTDARLQDLPELRSHLANLATPQDSGFREGETALAELKQDMAALRERRHEERQQFVAHVRAQAGSLAVGSCAPLLDRLARTYFGFDSGHMSADPVESLRNSLDYDEILVSATLSGFECVLVRDDLPDLDEIVRLDGEGKRSWFTFAVLAGLAERDRTECGGHRSLTADQIRRAVGFYYLSPRPTVQDSHRGWLRQADVPEWYHELVRSDAELVAEALAEVHVSKIRRKVHCEEHLAAVASDPKYRELAQLVAPSLLRAFPIRCTRPQILALRHLLWASVRYVPEDLAPWVDAKLTRSGMDVAQRTLWLSAGMLVSPDRHLAAAMEFIGKGTTVRARHLIGFLVPDGLPPFSMEWSTEQLATAVRGVGARIKPWHPLEGNELKVRLMTPADDAANKAQRVLSAWLGQLAKEPEEEAADALQSLASAPELAAWRHHILEARDRQAKVRRQAMYRIPTLEEVQTALRNAEPANVADLAALLVDRLKQLATQIRDGNTNDWQQYWNVDSHGRVEEPRPEPTCRDALLSALRRLLPTGVNVVDAQPEAQCADGKRADIRVACGGHAVPVEIKKNSHRELWSAINTQLIAKYARAPESSGFGVYLVLWFGTEHTETVPPAGRLPNTPDELRQRLEEQTPPDKRHKIKVVVVDVSPPGDPTA